MPGQANAIVQRLKTDTHVRFQDDWKVITFFIGGNDLCDYCHDQVLNFVHFIIRFNLCAIRYYFYLH